MGAFSLMFFLFNSELVFRFSQNIQNFPAFCVFFKYCKLCGDEDLSLPCCGVGCLFDGLRQANPTRRGSDATEGGLDLYTMHEILFSGLDLYTMHEGEKIHALPRRIHHWSSRRVGQFGGLVPE